MTRKRPKPEPEAPDVRRAIDRALDGAEAQGLPRRSLTADEAARVVDVLARRRPGVRPFDWRTDAPELGDVEPEGAA